MDVVELHDRCVEEFLSRVRRIPADGWGAPTPCQDWTVRDLVNHLVYEESWAVPLMAGDTIASVGDRFDGDLLGDDPLAVVERASRAARAAVGEPARSGRTVHLSFGDTPADEYARQLAADHLVHAWDLAVAVGADPRLPADLVATVARWFAADEREDRYRSGGWIGPRPEAAASSTDEAQDGLLVAFGRDPRWRPTGEG